jgi:hypothetical protein
MESGSAFECHFHEVRRFQPENEHPTEARRSVQTAALFVLASSESLQLQMFELFAQKKHTVWLMKCVSC